MNKKKEKEKRASVILVFLTSFIYLFLLRKNFIFILKKRGEI